MDERTIDVSFYAMILSFLFLSLLVIIGVAVNIIYSFDLSSTAVILLICVVSVVGVIIVRAIVMVIYEIYERIKGAKYEQKE